MRINDPNCNAARVRLPAIDAAHTASRATTFRLRAEEFNKLALHALEASFKNGRHVSVSELIRDALGEKYGLAPLVRFAPGAFKKTDNKKKG